MYGYKSVKWVTRLELLPKPVTGYWEQHGYDVDAWIGRSNGYDMAASAPEATRPGYVRRFTRTERLLHWTHAAAFFALLASGLILYVPSLSIWISRRNLVKNVHIWTAVAWAVALVLIVVGREPARACVETVREIETFDRDDRRWLRGRPAPQGRFNAGQKVNAILTVAFAILFAVSGFFLWLGERDHRTASTARSPFTTL